MTANRFQHVDIRVTDRAAAQAFYSKLMPVLGFPNTSCSVFTCFSAEGSPPQAPWFGFIEDKNHRPNANRIAFWAESREEVDHLAGVVREAGGRISSGPRACPEYTPSYYAVFFEDPSGNCLEICHLTD
jgi:catechol 2,3-dioxygenase-like lactoylglutathione lyase family enzyme